MNVSNTAEFRVLTTTSIKTIVLMMVAVNISETSVSTTRLHGAASQKTAIFLSIAVCQTR
jgi:hypothetical protein